MCQKLKVNPPNQKHESNHGTVEYVMYANVVCRIRTHHQSPFRQLHRSDRHRLSYYDGRFDTFCLLPDFLLSNLGVARCGIGVLWSARVGGRIRRGKREEGKAGEATISQSDTFCVVLSPVSALSNMLVIFFTSLLTFDSLCIL